MPAVLIVIFLVGAWQLYVTISGIDQFLLPAPTAVVSALYDDRALLWSNFQTTAVEIMLGVALACVVGLCGAVAIHLIRPLRQAVYPLLIASQTIPIVIIAPLLVAWLGFGILPKLVIITLVCFFPITVSTLDGLANTDRELHKLMQTLGASRLQAFWRAEAPAALPYLFSGAKIAVTVAVIAAVLAEQAGSNMGIGHLLLQAIPQLETARAYAAVLVLSLFAVLLFVALSLAERKLLPWANQTRRSERN